MTRTPVVMLPGALQPAALAYPQLIELLGDGVHVVAKELEVYAEAKLPRRYGLNTEVNGVTREADAAGFERFHLVGYSDGGACALAFASTYPDRLLSLALIEPAWAGNQGLGARELSVWSEPAPDELSAAVAALREAYLQFELDLDRLRAVAGPVYFANGMLSTPDFSQRQADRLAAVFGDFTVEVYDGDVPHRADPGALAEALNRLWAKGETV